MDLNSVQDSYVFKYKSFIMKMSIFYVTLLLLSMQLLVAAPVRSQELTKRRITLELRDESLLSAIKKIEQASGILFAYPPLAIAKFNHISLPRATRTVDATL